MAKKSIYQFNVTLKDIEPPIWRRFQVRSDISFHQLHKTLQVVMGWWDYHLYLFEIRGMPLAPQDILREMEMEGMSSYTNKIDKLVTYEGMEFEYEYDFGDSWKHLLTLEKILPTNPDGVYPRCLEGARACPPEDVGGVGGYEEFVASLKNPKHPERERNLEWSGGSFDPEAFDLARVTKQFAEGVYWNDEMVAAPLTSRNTFTNYDAEWIWRNIPEHLQAKLIGTTWCHRCRDMTTMMHFKGSIKQGDLYLRGECIRCWGKVGRFIGGGE